MEFYIGFLRYVLPVLACFILARCCFSLLANRPRVHKMARLINKTDNSEIDIDHWETSVGRSKSCDIPLRYPTVSRFHGVISKRKKNWIVTDTFSKAGIKINGKVIGKSAPIFDGDTVTFGEIPLEFKCDDALNAQSKSTLRKAADSRGKTVLVDIHTEKPYYLSKKENTVGREDGSTVLLNDASVSKHHARIFRTPKGWAVSDLDSANGTRLNGRFINQPQLIFDEDRLTFGGVTLIFYEQ